MNLKKIIEPRSFALFGVSNTSSTNPANIIYYKNKADYKTKIYCINPSGGEINGERIYRSISEVEQPVDAAVFVIRSEYIPAAMKECVSAGVSGGLVISGGFGEAGRVDLQDEICRISRENNFPFIGPNGLGVYSPPFINTLFFPDERFVKPLPGNIALVSQSGGVLVDLMIKFTQEGIGLSRVASLGNKAVTDEVDILNFFKTDDRTDVIGLYIEGFSEGRGRDFIDTLKKIGKPVVVLKAGKTPASLSAIASHTAAIAGDYRIFSEVIKETEAFEAHNIPEFMAACEGLSRFGKHRVENVAVLTMSGGHGVIVSDYCHAAGLDIVRFPDRDSEELKLKTTKNIHGIAAFTNPIDLTGSATNDDYFISAQFALERDYVDALLLLFLPFIPAIDSTLPPRLTELRRKSDKPIVCYIPFVPKFGVFIEAFEAHGIPVSHTIEGAIDMLRAIRLRHAG